MNHSISSGLTPVASPWRRAWKALISPGARLMSQLRLSGKLALLVVAMSIPLYALIWQGVSDALANDQAVHQAEQAVKLVDKLIEGQAALQRLRALTAHQLAAKGASTEPGVKEQRQAVQASMKAINEQWATSPALPGASVWPYLRQRADSLAQGQHPSRPQAAVDEFNEVLMPWQSMIQQLIAQAHVAQAAGKVGEPLTGVLVGAAARLAATAAETQALGGLVTTQASQATQPDAAAQLARASVLGLAWALERDLASLETDLNRLNQHATTVPGSMLNAREMVGVLVQDAQRRFGGPTIDGSAQSFLDITDMVLEQVYAVQQDILSRLAVEMEVNHARAHRSNIWLLLAYAAATLFLAYLIAAFYVSFQNALRMVLQGMQATASGDLSHKLLIRGNDELTEIARNLDRMNDRLSTTTSDIRSRAARVDLSGRQMSESSQQLAQRTDEQAGSVRSTAAAIEQISSAVSLNAQAAREVDSLSERLFVQAEEGNAAMAETVMAMDELQTSSSRVTDMVAVIDDVAFHTGMLALNASIEAARAGVSGKGFAVVAGEVRQLALRCAEAADEIRELIKASSTQVQDSSSKLQHVSVALDTLVNGVREVSGQLRVIASASTQQSAALQEVESNIKSLQSITAENAALVETSNASANTLLAQGASLAATVAAMRLRHGSADEARAMVERAVEHVQKVGREQALAEFNLAKSHWIDRDLFIFCFDRMGNIIANGLRPERVGENVNSLDGLRGSHHAEKLWEMADAGGGWVRYEMVNPMTGRMAPKESYVVPIEDDLLIGCGCYGKPKDLPEAAGTPRAPVAWSRQNEHLELAPA